MVVIWGVNYSIVKLALAEIPPLAFTALRLLMASGIFLVAILRESRAAGRDAGPMGVSRDDWKRIVVLAAIGHALYQLLFIGGLARTSASNSSLIIGCSPVAVAVLTALVGHERLTRWHWIGCALSVLGVYLIVGRGAVPGHGSMTGDLLTVGSITCWAVYTVGSRALLQRHSPLFVTGATMIAGSAMFAPIAAAEIASLAWTSISWTAWAALVFSAIFALFVAYLIWYTGVQQIGNARTSVYSNMVPIVAMTTAAIWIGEPIDRWKIMGAAAVLSGVAVTRVGRAAPERSAS